MPGSWGPGPGGEKERVSLPRRCTGVRVCRTLRIKPSAGCAHLCVLLVGSLVPSQALDPFVVKGQIHLTRDHFSLLPVTVKAGLEAL